MEHGRYEMANSEIDCEPRETSEELEHVAMPYTVLIVDDHPMFRDAVRRAIERTEDFVVAGEAGDAEEAVRMAASLRPRVAILDIGLPGGTGIDAAQRIREDCPDTLIVGLSVHDNAEHVKAMLQAGADGYLTKDVPAKELVDALRQVVLGNLYVCSAALRNLVKTAVSPELAQPTDREHSLTRREIEILRLLARGLSNRDIAESTSLSTTTVKGHVESILSKLGVEHRAGAVGAAVRLGILNRDDL